MRFTSCILLLGAALSQAVSAQTIESADFNATEALLEKGINITALPQLAALAERSSNAACSIACGSLRILYGSAVLTEGSTAYDSFTGGYWSVQQSSVDPYCIFKPASALDVSVSILIARLSQCPFAVKSGGHAAFAGASSIEGGITIALERIDDIVVSKDKKTVAIGPGNLWFDVYTTLQPTNLAVIGGRVSGIGVGGLTLGGGISFFSNIYGWACDNVASYEVVTASGVVLTASPSQNSDLFWALRGGGNNFGVVTKFNLNTIPLPGHLMWGGSRIHTRDQFPQVIDAFYNVGINSPKDPNAAQIMSFAYAQSVDLDLVSADLQYAKPIANASIFSQYFAIPPFIDNTKVRTLSDLTQQFNASNPNGLRETYWASTYKLTEDLVTEVGNIFYDELAAIKDAAGIVPAATLQVISKGMLDNMKKNGGNPLGLIEDAAQGPFLLVNLNMQWTNIADDARIMQANANIIRRADAYAKQNGLYNDYIYMNYASQYQAVVPSYGKQNQAKLKTIAAKYDPTGVYQRLQPGYFKLDGSPATGL
ncbi:Bifunctional solanapyrone synthase [Cyphellophora attinorum]|uniref:Bifunctional solanapyrone synthase n=1 Tax=Cyphellophora attinorum TaxID=1664694 RepID=A0A0N1P197_9EURO|nr:Bifunctional solanapyrone synthase [Phialophora attinorum]KPI40357.1 Bifunctional solanapyrone synthase [Phialophora attinorum]